MEFQISLANFMQIRVFYSQDNMEGASQCCLAKIALCPHSQYIRDLLEEGTQDDVAVQYTYIQTVCKTCFITSPPAPG